MENVTYAPYDTADYLKSEEDIAAYLEAVMEEGGDDPAYVAHALGAVARARKPSSDLEVSSDAETLPSRFILHRGRTSASNRSPGRPHPHIEATCRTATRGETELAIEHYGRKIAWMDAHPADFEPGSRKPFREDIERLRRSLRSP